MPATESTHAFQPSDIQTLGALGRGASTWGVISLAGGAIAIAICAARVALASALQQQEALQLIAVLGIAGVAMFTGLRYVRAGGQLRRVGRLGSDGVEETVRGFDALTGAFRLEAIVTGMSIALAFAGGLVLGAVHAI